MEVLRKKENNTTIENAEVLCDPCEGNNETETAENYCIDCNEFLCNSCAKVHRKSRMSRHHKVLDGDKMPRQKLVLSGDDVCSRHDGKPLEYFCNNHAGFYCASCVTLDHRNCKLEYLTEKAEGFEDSEDYRTLVNRIQKVSQLITGTKGKIGLCKGEAKSNHLKFLMEIREFRNNIETILQATEENAKEKANIIQTRDQYAFDSLSKRSDEMQGKIDAIVEMLDSLKACRQKSRLCIAAKQVETKINTFETELKEINVKARVSRYNFRGSEIMKRNIGSWGSLELLQFAADSTATDKQRDDEPDKGSDFEENKANNGTHSSAKLAKAKGYTDYHLSNRPAGHLFGVQASPQTAQIATFGYHRPDTLQSNNLNQGVTKLSDFLNTHFVTQTAPIKPLDSNPE